MTECERIIKEGILPKDFLKEEVICDFFVDKNRKKLWMILFDLLVKFDEVCKKHNINYFLCGGTLLGAVRHKGFIPWDDDIDVMIFREDYNKLLSFKDEFKEPYFFQCYDTDLNYYQTISKIRNSNTTAFNKITGYEGFNQGIFLDIFNLDNFVYEGAKDRFETVRRLALDIGTYSRINNPNLDDNNKARVKDYLARHVDPDETYKKIQEIIKQFNNIHTNDIFISESTINNFETYIFKRNDFSNAFDVEFEGYFFPAPIGYDNILKTAFGDYMSLPPIEKRGVDHSSFIFDPDIPYKKFMKKHLQGENNE